MQLVHARRVVDVGHDLFGVDPALGVDQPHRVEQHVLQDRHVPAPEVPEGPDPLLGQYAQPVDARGGQDLPGARVARAQPADPVPVPLTRMSGYS